MTAARHSCWLLCLLSLAACDRLLPFGTPPPERRSLDGPMDRPATPAADAPAAPEWRRDRARGAERPPDAPRRPERPADRAPLDKPTLRDLVPSWKDKAPTTPDSVAVWCGLCNTCCVGGLCASTIGPTQCGAGGVDCVNCTQNNPCQDFTCLKGACVPTSPKTNGTKCGGGSQICCGGKCCPPFITACPTGGC